MKSLEDRYDKQFRVVFDAIRKMMSDNKVPKPEIGFHTAMRKLGRNGGPKVKHA